MADTPQKPKHSYEPWKSSLISEQRRNVIEGLKTRWRDPAYREKMNRAIREGIAKRKKKEEVPPAVPQ